MRRPRLVIGLVTAVVAATVVGTSLSASAGTTGPLPGAALPAPVAGAVAADPTPSPTTTPSTGATGSPSPSASAAPCDGTDVPIVGCLPFGGGGSPSPSATPTATTSPSPSPSTVTATPTVTVTPGTITAKQKATVSGTADPGADVELYAYSRPSTKYALVRTGKADENGDFSFEVGPSGNTRLYAMSGGVMSDTTVLMVRTDLNLKVTALGKRTYRFSGSTLPKRKGQLVTVFYQKPGGPRVIASRARVTEQGTYSVTRTFGSGGTYDLYTGTGADNDNAGNTSNRYRGTIR